MEVPIVTRKDYQLNNISEDDYMDLMDDGCDQRSDLKVPCGCVGDEIKKKVEAGDAIMVTILKAVGKEVAVGVKSSTS